MNRIGSAVALFLLFAAASFAQQLPFRERIEVGAVLLDVTVTDNRGNQILGLTKDDFVVVEDGVEQTVDSIDFFTNRRLLTGPEEKAAFSVENVRQERYFILMIHKPGDSRFLSEVMEARNAAIQFVDREMLPTDRAAVASYDFRLKLFSDFTSDKKALRTALMQAGRFSNGLLRVPSSGVELPSILSQLDIGEMVNRTGRIYDAIRVLADAVQPIAARKVLVLFSPGIGERSDFSSLVAENEETFYRPMARALNRANVTVYAMPLPKGLRPSATQTALERMAHETGGEYFRNVVSYTGTLRRIENLNNGYYLLTYRSRKPEQKSGFQRVNVRLRNPEFRLRVRQGYGYGS